MHHMSDFNGQVYRSPDMNKAVIRKVVRAKITASILLSNFNQVRAQVIEKAYTFYKDKPSLLELVNAKRKENTKKNAEKKRKEAAEKLKDMSGFRRGKRKIV